MPSLTFAGCSLLSFGICCEAVLSDALETMVTAVKLRIAIRIVIGFILWRPSALRNLRNVIERLSNWLRSMPSPPHWFSELFFAVSVCRGKRIHRRDAENAEVAQRMSLGAQTKRLTRVTAPAILEVQIAAEGSPAIVTAGAGVVPARKVLKGAR